MQAVQWQREAAGFSTPEEHRTCVDPLSDYQASGDEELVSHLMGGSLRAVG